MKLMRGAYPAHSLRVKILSGPDAGHSGYIRYVDDHWVWVAVGSRVEQLRPGQIERQED